MRNNGPGTFGLGAERHRPGQRRSMMFRSEISKPREGQSNSSGLASGLPSFPGLMVVLLFVTSRAKLTQRLAETVRNMYHLDATLLGDISLAAKGWTRGLNSHTHVARHHLSRKEIHGQKNY
jgi:hypothetical protein